MNREKEIEEIEHIKIVYTNSTIKKDYDFDFKHHRFFVISYSLFGAIILILAIVALVITGAYPCVHTKCNQHATCFNTPFYADCVCNEGFAGDGRDHCDECGITYFKNNAIEAGIGSVPYSWPATGIIEFMYTTLAKVSHQKVLVYNYDACGAVLINRKTALTAAHCIKTDFSFTSWASRTNTMINVTFNNFHPTLESIYSLYFGINKFVYYSVDLPHVQMGDVKDIIIHPDYNKETYENDIAIVTFLNEINLDRYTQIACLPNKTSYDIPKQNHNKAFVAGYSSAGSSWTSLNQYNIILDLYNNSMCENVQSNRTKNWNMQFCAGEYDLFLNETSKCHGDYGSPLYVLDEINGKKKYVASGLLSYDVPCNVEHSPAVFTRISSYIDWIIENSRYYN
ncbi:unnamed protein product [Brachionus calyciflorus]|uniref:Uncharacterized protein n=1 Tax=Brachionus calyciflorus TaxID=104777 RepID=A0A814G0I4_9BILA|nr:unnamed protein product [Brachionus calyciflorus]